MTQIWSADIIISGQSFENLKSIPLKKLPTHILISESGTLIRIKKAVGDKKYENFLNKIGSLDVKINFIKYIGNVNYDIL